MTTYTTTSELTNAMWVVALLIAWVIITLVRGIYNGYHRYLELTGTNDWHCVECHRVYHSAKRLDRHMNWKH